MTGPSLIAALAGCGQHASVAAGQPSASRASRPAQVTSTRAAPATSKNPATGRKAARSPEPTASSPAAPPPKRGTPLLAGGLYVDAADGTPHYVMALAHSGRDAVRGSVSYLYQDGRIANVGRYSGKLSKNGHLRIVFSNGRTLAGTYRSAHLTLVTCTSVLARATHPGGCQFTYHGHAP
jgi:hypothetical protein